MKIEIENPTKEFYKEFINILCIYKKIKANPKSKIEDKFKQNYFYLILTIIMEIVSIIYYLKTKDYIGIILIVLFFICIILALFLIINLNINLKNYINNSSKSIFKINENEIELSKCGSDFKLMWSNIKNVIINKETICFVPIDNTTLICIPSIYSKEIIESLKKYKKEGILIKNS